MSMIRFLARAVDLFLLRHLPAYGFATPRYINWLYPPKTLEGAVSTEDHTRSDEVAP